MNSQSAIDKEEESDLLRPVPRRMCFFAWNHMPSQVLVWTPVTDALAQSGVSRTHFNRKRPIAEASKVDMPRLQQAIQQVIKPTVENIFPQARTICNQNLPALRTLHARGEVVAPKENY